MSSLSHLETARRFYEEANHVTEVGATLSSKRKLSEEGVRFVMTIMSRGATIFDTILVGRASRS
jgi:hypothetical protein